jgi:hypothetical protein
MTLRTSPQVVSNLLSNACKFVAEGTGEIECSLGYTEAPPMRNPWECVPATTRSQLKTLLEREGVREPCWHGLTITVRCVGRGCMTLHWAG